MSNYNRIPVTIVTGFLGSGKTTLLRHLLKYSKNKLAVLINEFGSIGLDGDLFKTCDFCSEDELEGRIVELNNGCLCCTVQDDFLPTMQKILSCTEKLDGILIETSGLAMPRPLVQALAWPEIRSKVFLNGVITIIDGEAFISGNCLIENIALQKQRKEIGIIDHQTSLEELLSNQLEAADLVLISRSDIISSTSMTSIIDLISSKLRFSIPIIPISKGYINPSIILGIDCSINKFDINEDHHNEDHHHLNVFSVNLKFECQLENINIKEILIEIVKEYKIIRLKGRCWMEGKLFPLQIQMVGERYDSWFEKAPESVWKPKKGGLDLIVLSLQECPYSEILKKFDRLKQ